jgi:hypothetical protein
MTTTNSAMTVEQIVEKIYAAEKAGRSQSTMNRLWRQYHTATAARKGIAHGSWHR